LNISTTEKAMLAQATGSVHQTAVLRTPLAALLGADQATISRLSRR